MPSMSPPPPPPRDRLSIARDIAGVLLIVAGLVGGGFVLYGVTPVALLLYLCVVAVIAGIFLASGVGR